MKTLKLNEYGVKELSNSDITNINGGFGPMAEWFFQEIFDRTITWLENYKDPRPLPEPNPWFNEGDNDWSRVTL